jgi:uncharacterized protein (TIGR03435 family)
VREIFGLALVCMVAHGQAAPAKVEFEVASVKLYVPPDSGPRMVPGMTGGPGSSDPGQVRYANQSLMDLLRNAYNVKRHQIVGPPWLDANKFLIIAKVPDGAGKEQVRVMLQNLLRDRFRLAVHRETKELPIYALIVGKSGPKMKESKGEAEDRPDVLPTGPPGSDIGVKVKMTEDGCPNFPGLRLATRMIFMNGRACLTAYREGMPGLADLLSDRMERPVLDMTGLAGIYDFTLHYDPGNAAPSDNPLPDVFAAVQSQLGLKLESRKGLVDLVVIDHVEKLPTEN